MIDNLREGSKIQEEILNQVMHYIEKINNRMIKADTKVESLKDMFGISKGDFR